MNIKSIEISNNLNSTYSYCMHDVRIVLVGMKLKLVWDHLAGKFLFDWPIHVHILPIRYNVLMELPSRVGILRRE